MFPRWLLNWKALGYSSMNQPVGKGHLWDGKSSNNCQGPPKTHPPKRTENTGLIWFQVTLDAHVLPNLWPNASKLSQTPRAKKAMTTTLQLSQAGTTSMFRTHHCHLPGQAEVRWTWF